MRTFLRNLFAAGASLILLLSGCALAPGEGRDRPAGHLLLIGGGLDDDVRPVYERLLHLASAHGPPRLVLVMTATQGGYDTRSEREAKTEALRIWAPGVPLEVIGRETPPEEAVAVIDRATGLLFTGGDQSRITRQYRPRGADSPEWAAMKRLLARGGVIAGCSAGDTMMGAMMALAGDNAAALGLKSRSRDGAVLPLQIGPGLGLLSGVVTESHFFERDRIGRLVASLESSGCRFGIGVGEAAALEVDLARGELEGVTVSDSLLVDGGAARSGGNIRSGWRARLIHQGERVSLRELAASACPAPAPMPVANPETLRISSPSQHRQLASWRVFMEASRPGSGAWELYFDEGWRITAWPDRGGWVAFEIRPASGPRLPGLRNIATPDDAG